MSYRKPPATLRAHRLFDRLFLGGCIATYLVLIGSVVTALRLYGG